MDLFYKKKTDQYKAQILDNDGVSQLIDVTFSLTPGTANTRELLRGGANGPQVETFDFAFQQVTSPTPEPGSIVLLGSGLLGLAGVVRRRSRA